MRASPVRVSPWELATVVSAGAVALGLVGVSRLLAVPAGFAAVVVGFLALEAALFYHVDRTTRHDGGRQRFTLATALTVVRASAVLVLAGFAVVGRPDGSLAWVPALLFGAAALFDALDGAIARATDTVSAFGARLDGRVDGLAVLVGTLVAVRFGAAPAVFLLLGVARYAFVGGLALRRRLDLPVAELPPRTSRKALGALGMVAVFVVLVPTLDPSVTRPLAVAAMVPPLLGFVRDWLLVTGRL